MLASRANAATSKSTREAYAYVCVSCRLKAQKRRYGTNTGTCGEDNVGVGAGGLPVETVVGKQETETGHDGFVDHGRNGPVGRATATAIATADAIPIPIPIPIPISIPHNDETDNSTPHLPGRRNADALPPRSRPMPMPAEHLHQPCLDSSPGFRRSIQSLMLDEVSKYRQYRLDDTSAVEALPTLAGLRQCQEPTCPSDVHPLDELCAAEDRVLPTLDLNILHPHQDILVPPTSASADVDEWDHQDDSPCSPPHAALSALPITIGSPVPLPSTPLDTSRPLFRKQEQASHDLLLRKHPSSAGRPLFRKQVQVNHDLLLHKHTSHRSRPLFRKHMSPTVKSVFAGEQTPRRTLESTIDEHLEEPLAPPHPSGGKTVSPGGTKLLSLRPTVHGDPEVFSQFSNSRVADEQKAFEYPKSAPAGRDGPARPTAQVKQGESTDTSQQLDRETKTAVGAIEDAASVAAMDTQAARQQSQPSLQSPRTLPNFTSPALGGPSWHNSRMHRPPLSSGQPGGISARLYHSTVHASQQSAAALAEDHDAPDTPALRYSSNRQIGHKSPSLDDTNNPNGIRAQLRKWQELHGSEDPTPEVVEQDDWADMDTPVNNLTRLPDDSAARRQMQADEEEKEAFSRFADTGKEGYDGSAADDTGRFLKTGDLVEIEYLSSERESILAVFVQTVNPATREAQFFTMQGRWMHLPVKGIAYSIPGWISPESIKPLLEHLPTPEETLDRDALWEKAYIEDLSVPRDVAAPLVRRLIDFYNESQEIYRKHASALDDAHNILAHDTDLRYGSLVSAATTLLRTPSDKLPLTALYTVRKALAHAGFAFNIDRRSHRLTGYMQIRSKEQVRMVDHVRTWIRQWQDDLAQTAGMEERQRAKRNPSKGAQVVYGFLEKAKAIVMKNRESRHPMPQGTTRPCLNVGISKVRLPITETSDCIQTHIGHEFTADETDVVRFLESWACSSMFVGLPRIESLPPLLLQATGLYDDGAFKPGTGFVFLQELGTIMPYENRIRFDQHLLLPSSQHSKPLQNLMSNILSMKNTHNFSDSMEDLRREWGNLPVYCIDEAGAHEIDDGISIEPSGRGTDGKEHYWVHIHIANPTAFFPRDHPLAKMARHMGETIYMPERTYMMLPRWATQRHFSLGPDRPALTFSAKLDEDGNTVDQKVTPGWIRNVMALTPKEVEQLVSDDDAAAAEQTPELVLTVGGRLPPTRTRKSRLPDATDRNINDLRLLQTLAAKRANLRKSNGGIFFDSHKPKVNVAQAWKSQGLAWTHPYRQGSRIVEGDPVIQMRTTGLHNWFAPNLNVVDILVRECMLLACETAASWCSKRKIPVINRGTTVDPHSDSRKFWEETMAPAMREDGSFPMHLGVQYIHTLGSPILSTEPKRHAVLGMDHYSKVTSPLRRYGDMVLHWQIEAALRHEAQTGQSLTSNHNTDRSFLPFSKPILDSIMLGLQPRESMISRAKSKAEDFWTCMLLFRKHHFNEDGGLPFKTLRVFIPSAPGLLRGGASATYCLELGLNFTVYDPRDFGLPEARQGDVWEVEMDCVDVYLRGTFVRPIGLVGREGAGIV